MNFLIRLLELLGILPTKEEKETLCAYNKMKKYNGKIELRDKCAIGDSFKDEESRKAYYSAIRHKELNKW